MKKKPKTDRVKRVNVTSTTNSKNKIKRSIGSSGSKSVRKTTTLTTGGGGPIIATKSKRINNVNGSNGTYKSKIKTVTLNNDGSATLEKNKVKGKKGKYTKKKITARRANRMINRFSK